MIRLRAAFLLLVAPILILACTSEPDVDTQDIVTSIPWSTGERFEYRLVDGDGKELGTGLLVTSLEGSNTRLQATFEGESSSDVSTVVVNSQTLKPVSSTRDIKTDGDDEFIEVMYSEKATDPACTVEPPRGCATIRRGDQQTGMSVPEHSYDNDSSLWLWRTIDFEEGYEAGYVTVITNRRDSDVVLLRITGKESVTVPAGTFNAWRLEIRTANARQVAWIADTPFRALVKYDNDRNLIFELTSAP